jgi:hypothetical protein
VLIYLAKLYSVKDLYYWKLLTSRQCQHEGKCIPVNNTAANNSLHSLLAYTYALINKNYISNTNLRTSQNFTLDWAVILRHTLKLRCQNYGPNLSRVTFCVIFLSTSRQMLGQYFKICQYVFLPYPFQFIFIITWAFTQTALSKAQHHCFIYSCVLPKTGHPESWMFFAVFLSVSCVEWNLIRPPLLPSVYFTLHCS